MGKPGKPNSSSSKPWASAVFPVNAPGPASVVIPEDDFAVPQVAEQFSKALRKCRRGHLTEVANVPEGMSMAVWQDLSPGAPVKPFDSGIRFDPAKTCVHCLNEWLTEEFALVPVTEPEVAAAYRLGGFEAAVACLQGLRTQSVEGAMESMALMKGRPLTDHEREVIKEVMGGGK